MKKHYLLKGILTSIIATIIVVTIVYAATTIGTNISTDGTVIVDVDDAEALLVRKDGDGGDILTVDTTNSTIDVLSGLFNISQSNDLVLFTLGTDTRIDIDAASTAHDDTGGTINVETLANATSVKGINATTTLNSDINNVSGFYSAITGPAAGLTLGNSISAYSSEITCDPDDLFGAYSAFTAGNANINGSGCLPIALYVGTGYESVIVTYSGDITFTDYDAKIRGATTESIDSAGGSIEISAAEASDGGGGGLPYDGGSVYIYGGQGVNGGNDGYVVLGDEEAPSTHTLGTKDALISQNLEIQGTLYINELAQSDLPATCTQGEIQLDTGGATVEFCYCRSANDWVCSAMSSGPSD